MALSISSHHQYEEDSPFSGLEPPPSKRIKAHSSPPPKLYDVFINHRGPDVKETAALQLYKSLRDMGFQVFLDCQELELGDYFPSNLENAIRSASVHIAVFSKGYAESPWCLAELVFMLKTDAKIIPVFYDVRPCDLRHIGEKGVYADAFAGYQEKGRYLNKLEKWKGALHCVSFINGYEFNKKNEDFKDMCEKVVSAVLKKDLEITKSSHVATHLRELNKSNVDKTKCVYGSKYPVGLDKLVVNFERECLGRKGDENIVGILGRGGSGKTTLAKGVYNSIVSKYDGSCFLFDVREASASNRLMSLQRKLINDLFHQNHPKFQSINEGTSYFRNCMKRGSSLRFLIVLDDIDCLDQLDALLDRDALNSNSLVIVTTRDKRVLAGAGINSHYNLGTMDKESSTHLFCWNAFGQPLPASEYEDLVDEFVTASGGSPLALKVFGSHVYGRNRNYWALELKKIRVSLPGGIKQRLKISFDSLDSTEQQIFMDIACFFISRPKDMAIRIWEASGWDFEPALQSLQYKSLVEIDDVSSAFRMHDHLRDLGREMAAIVYPHRLWHSQRLKSLELKGFQSTVCELSGQNIRCLGSMFDRSMSSQITFFFGKTDDCDETLTALLWLEMCNYGRKFTSIPSWIPQQNLKFLQIKNATSSERKKHNHVTEL